MSKLALGVSTVHYERDRYTQSLFEEGPDKRTHFKAEMTFILSLTYLFE